MAIQDKGFEVALNGIKNASTKIRLYGEGNNAPGQAQTFGLENITWNNPSDVSGTWRLVSNAGSPPVFEITQTFLDTLPSGNGIFEAQGVEIWDNSTGLILKKAFPSPYTFDVPGELTVEQVLIEIQ